MYFLCSILLDVLDFLTETNVESKRPKYPSRVEMEMYWEREICIGKRER